MPRKKLRKDASTAKTKTPNLFESWLAKQPAKPVRAKAGYVSAEENGDTSWSMLKAVLSSAIVGQDNNTFSAAASF
jgi:hypothetical protein